MVSLALSVNATLRTDKTEGERDTANGGNGAVAGAGARVRGKNRLVRLQGLHAVFNPCGRYAGVSIYCPVETQLPAKNNVRGRFMAWPHYIQ